MNPGHRGTRETLESSYGYAREKGLATWDPFDVKGCALSLWTYRSRFGAPVRKALHAADLLAPRLLRKSLRLKPVPSAGGVARWLQASLAMSRLRRREGETDETEMREARAAMDWLALDARPGPAGMGWGLPFDWQAFVVVPAGAPIGHTTMAVLNALQDAREEGIEPDPSLLASGADFLTGGLNHTVRELGSVALSYTALDHSQVINTNAEIAAVLMRLGRKADQPLVQALVQFVLESQNPDGSWFYSAPDAGEGRQVVDNYHTGMILTALMELVAEYPEIGPALEKGWRFHLDGHFEPGGCPKMRPHSRWPVDAYSAGESVLALLRAECCETLEHGLRAECREVRDRLVGFIVREMAYPGGGFFYRQWPVATMRLDSLRWANALLCQALAEACLAEA
ncbi:MAG: hypothetical protein AB7F50_12070 [Fimbriimonadaceae bacterium]